MKNYTLHQQLIKEVKAGNVTMSSVGNLSIFKYTADCHKKGNWNEWNIQARGIIFDDKSNIICRPMPKFFNLGERPESSIDNLPDSAYIVYEKLDGSCGNAYLNDGKIYVATPGSMESEQAMFATEWINYYLFCRHQKGEFAAELEHCTPIFEIIWKDNPGANVVNYGDRNELVLLAIRLHNGEEISPHMVDSFAVKYGFARPAEYNIEVANDMDKHIEKNAEGYVIYYPSTGLRVKVKSDLYKMLHKMLDQLSPKGILELIQGREFRVVHKTLEECSPELAKQADDIAANLRRKMWDIKEEAVSYWQQVKDMASRKEQAMFIQKHAPQKVWGLVFALIDNRDIDYATWDVVKKGLKNEDLE